MDGTTVIQDQVYGEVRVANESLDDQVLLKADGRPTYHLASVVDDHSMEISHVMRGQVFAIFSSKPYTLAPRDVHYIQIRSPSPMRIDFHDACLLERLCVNCMIALSQEFF